jgi:tetratricopeptide (TPR) repeat protein
VTDARDGQIITFYSYKGGTGRSMVLANVAWILASGGKRVLVADWDLEAPGLHRYFRPFLLDKELTSSEGIIDFVVDYTDQVLTPVYGEKPLPIDWYVEHADIRPYTVSLAWSFARGGALDFVPAGRQGPSYSRRVNSFDWQNFYDRMGGGAFLEAARSSMRAYYDYILIDSRTGVSDTAGISTVQLPDKLVVCFTLNNQSIEGAAAVASSVTQQREGLPIFPIPTRVELSEKDKVAVRRTYARERLGHLPRHLDAVARVKYWSAVETLYIPYYAYEEILATFGDERSESHSVLRSAEQITGFLTNGEVEHVTPPERELREWVRDQFRYRPINIEWAQARVATLPDEVPSEPSALPEGSRMPLSRSSTFVGRADELRTLARTLREARSVAICGMAGVGKTQFAAEFVHRYGQYFAGGVFWLNFGEPSSIPSEVAACGNPGLPELRAEFRTLSFAEQLRLVIDAWRSDVPRLLVFDGCEDPDLLERWRPARGGAHVLLTSRRLVWDQSPDLRKVDLAVLPRATSLALLLSRLIAPNVPRDDLEEVAKAVGDLPLAVQVAGDAMARFTSPGQVADFVANLRQLGDRSLTTMSPDAALGNIQTTVATAFSPSLARLDREQPRDRLALDLLARAARLAPGVPIPHTLLELSVTPPDKVTFQAGMTRLAEVGLLEPLPDQDVRVHPLVSNFVRLQLADDGASAGVDAALLKFADTLRQQDDAAGIRRLEVHLREAAEAAFKRDDSIAVPLWNELGSSLLNAGEVAEAQRLFERALSVSRRVFGPDHLETAATLNNLGRSFQAQGGYIEARKALEEALSIYQRALGDEHPDTAATLANLGAVAQRQGDYTAALDCFERVLAIRQRQFGPDDLPVASARNNLGLALASLGRLPEAEQHLTLALHSRESAAPASVETTSSLNNLGLVLSSEGKLAEAEGYFRRALERSDVRRADTATTQANLASVLAARGEFAEAADLFQVALATQEMVLGPDHPDLAATLNNLGRVEAQMGETQAAMDHLRRALGILERSLGPDHTSTARVRANLRELEKRAEA